MLKLRLLVYWPEVLPILQIKYVSITIYEYVSMAIDFTD